VGVSKETVVPFAIATLEEILGGSNCCSGEKSCGDSHSVQRYYY